MVTEVVVHRLAAFTDDPAGGNTAGVVLTDRPLGEDEMQRIAAEVGCPETAFLTPNQEEDRTVGVRYFSPAAEVPFCGHATIASAVWLGTQVGTGAFAFATPAGTVPVMVEQCDDALMATLTSVPARVETPPESLTNATLHACGLERECLAPAYPPAVASAGARHLVLVLRERVTLAGLDYDFDRLRATMTDHGLITVAFLWPEPGGPWHARNLFPVGGVVEDPATGAAAAAFGAYLRSLDSVTPPATLEIRQGEDMGRPSRLLVTVPPGDEGIRVTGTAVPIPA